jgi:hypothetical protein
MKALALGTRKGKGKVPQPGTPALQMKAKTV